MAAWLLVVLCGMLAAPQSEARLLGVSGTDSAAIEGALDQARPGDMVALGAGTYSLTEAIKPGSGVHLQGAGVEKAVLRPGREGLGALVILEGVEDVEIEGITFDGGGDQELRGISAHNSRKLNLHDLAFRDMLLGIHFNGTAPTRKDGVTDSVIAECTFDNMAVENAWGGGVRFSWGSSRNLIEDCVIRETGRGGIFGDNGSNDLVIRQNTVSGSHGEALGIEVWSGCNRCVIEDNTIDHWLSLGGVDYCAARRNVIRDKTGSVKFIGIEAIGSYLVVTDNYVDDGQQIGISVSGTTPKDYHFYGYNRVRQCIEWGAQFQGESSGTAHHYFYRCGFNGTTVGRGNPIYPGDDGNGFRTNGNTQHCVFEECDFAENGRYGLQLGGEGVDFLSFVRCAIVGNKGAAVVGPGAYHGVVTDSSGYRALEFVDCRVDSNGVDTLPPAKAFPHPPPTAAFEVIGQLKAGEPVTFVSRATAAEGRIAKVLWDLGDGPPLVGEKVTWTYTHTGTYRVTMIAWDDSGRGARAEREVRVESRASDVPGGPAPAAAAPEG